MDNAHALGSLNQRIGVALVQQILHDLIVVSLDVAQCRHRVVEEVKAIDPGC